MFLLGYALPPGAKRGIGIFVPTSAFYEMT